MNAFNKSSLSYDNPLKIKFSTDYLKNISTSPGVYFMLDDSNVILYIGKAKNLKNRLSFYFSAKPGKAEDHTLEMIENICAIRFELYATEHEALTREKDLLHAIRPPYNRVGVEPNHYLFIGTRTLPVLEKHCKREKTTPLIPITFQLSKLLRMQQEGYQVYGCFKHRRVIKAGYTALLRLIHASTLRGHRFYYPAKISRFSPPWIYKSQIPSEWIVLLDRFLKGENMDVLHLLFEHLLASDFIPRFMYPSLHEDFDTVVRFFKQGPQQTSEFKKRFRKPPDIISMKQMDGLIASLQLKSVS